jgi:hypothetical protein
MSFRFRFVHAVNTRLSGIEGSFRTVGLKRFEYFGAHLDRSRTTLDVFGLAR